MLTEILHFVSLLRTYLYSSHYNYRSGYNIEEIVIKCSEIKQPCSS